MEFFLVRIFLYLDGIRRDTEYFSIFSPNVRKYGPEKTPYFDTFHTVMIQKITQLTGEDDDEDDDDDDDEDDGEDEFEDDFIFKAICHIKYCENCFFPFFAGFQYQGSFQQT